MSKIQVKYRGHLAAVAGIAGETMEARNVESVLKSLREHHGREAEKTARTMFITVNGESILLLRRYKTPLKEGDEVSFFPICAGG